LQLAPRRFKAVGTIVGANDGRLCREGNLTADAALKALEGIGARRTAEARGAALAWDAFDLAGNLLTQPLRFHRR